MFHVTQHRCSPYFSTMAEIIGIEGMSDIEIKQEIEKEAASSSSSTRSRF